MAKGFEGSDDHHLLMSNVTSIVPKAYGLVNDPLRSVADDINEIASGRTLAQDDVKKIIEELGYSLSYNEVTMRFEDEGQPVNDSLQGKILSQMRQLSQIVDTDESRDVLRNRSEIKDIILSAHLDKSYNPIKKYFTNLELEETPTEFSTLCDLIGDVDGNFKIFMQKFLLGAVHRVFTGHQNYTLVLQGDQGMGKSYFTKWLCSPVGKEYHQEGPIEPRNKDHVLRLASCFLWAVDELEDTISKASIAAIKAFLTIESVSERPPYGRSVVNRPRMCSIIASTNSKEFLNDTTGNRRYLTLNINKINKLYSKFVDVNKLWAEVMGWYLKGRDPLLTEEQLKLQLESNKKVEEKDALVDFLEDNVEFVESDISLIPVNKLFSMVHFEFHTMKVKEKNQINKKIREFLRGNGVSEERVGRNRYFKRIRLSVDWNNRYEEGEIVNDM